MSTFKYKVHDLYNPILSALHSLGGSASVSEIEDSIIASMGLSEEEVSVIHRGTATKLNYRLRWARNHLKHFGLLENSSRGIWSLTGTGHKTKSVIPAEVIKVAHSQGKKLSKNLPKIDPDEEEGTVIVGDAESIDEEVSWQEKALEVVKTISAPAFERLCQRLLRELGFKNVEVTGKPNDGGIDGKGILRLG